jgi:hypothetical protein
LATMLEISPRRSPSPDEFWPLYLAVQLAFTKWKRPPTRSRRAHQCSLAE